MQLKHISLEEFKRNTLRYRDRAQARLEALGDKATFADEMAVVCAQSQVDYLESLDDEPLTFADANEESSPHLMKLVAPERSSSALNGRKVNTEKRAMRLEAHVEI